jgi:hypothetical protein
MTTPLVLLGAAADPLPAVRDDRHPMTALHVTLGAVPAGRAVAGTR